MKKICEIDAAEVYHQTGELPWQGTTKHRLQPEWCELVFTTPQLKFLEKHSYTARPHPRHSPTVEIFINEQDLTEQDWTLIRLLF